MVITIIDNETIAKKCSRTFFKFNMAFRKNDRTFDSFAAQLDHENSFSQPKMEKDKLTNEEIKAYDRLRREFKRKTGLEIKLTKTYSAKDPMRNRGYGQTIGMYQEVNGTFKEESHYRKPLWITELKLSPELRQLKAEVVYVHL